MKKLILLSIVTAVCLVGCVDKESSKAENPNLTPDVEQLQAELAAANAQIESMKNEIASLKAENIEIQDLAMKTVMTMLEKQIAHDKKIQDNLKSKVNQLEVANKDLESKLEKVQADKPADKQVSLAVD